MRGKTLKGLFFLLLIVLILFLVGCGGGSGAGGTQIVVLPQLDQDAVLNEYVDIIGSASNPSAFKSQNNPFGLLCGNNFEISIKTATDVVYTVSFDGQQINGNLINNRYIFTVQTNGKSVGTYFLRITASNANQTSINSRESVSANIWLRLYTDDVRICLTSSPTGGGNVCFGDEEWSSEASKTVDPGTDVYITSQPEVDYTFDGWYMNSLKIYSERNCTVTINEETDIEARFINNIRPEIEKIKGVSGTTGEDNATFEWNGSDRDGSIDHFEYRLDSDDPVNTGEKTYKWNDYSSGQHVFSVVAVDDKGAESIEISWDFTYEPPSYTLTVQSSPTAGGAIRLDSGAWADSDSVTELSGTAVQIGAEPSQGYTFDGWYENGSMLSLLNPYSLTLTSDRRIYASFKENQQGQTLLKDLGSMGNLNESGNVYNIIDNTSVGYMTVSIEISRLPADFASASGWKLVLNEQDFVFSQNQFSNTIYEVSIDDTITDKIDDIQNAVFETVQ
ncbi:MAG TPA: hypothetical protein PK466_13070, partial [Thermotogota bacterium]|nr:hypothetical protein [Thermotogota bacterium]HPJ89522.1 hypothetical protein [Thermotogota bacterium]HPR97255.1 hypothetical protein [Thermotogota bacterium]